MDIFAPHQKNKFRLRWDPAQKQVGQFWSRIQTKIVKTLGRKGLKISKDDVAFVSLDEDTLLEDEDDFNDFVDLARDAGSSSVQLRATILQAEAAAAPTAQVFMGTLEKHACVTKKTSQEPHKPVLCPSSNAQHLLHNLILSQFDWLMFTFNSAGLFYKPQAVI